MSKDSNKIEQKGRTNIVNYKPEHQPFHAYGQPQSTCSITLQTSRLKSSSIIHEVVAAI
jgi:hypothetical protein